MRKNITKGNRQEEINRNKMEENEIANRIYDTLMENTEHPQFPISETTNEEIDCENNIISFRIGKADFNIIIRKVFVGNN